MCRRRACLLLPRLQPAPFAPPRQVDKERIRFKALAPEGGASGACVGALPVAS